MILKNIIFAPSLSLALFLALLTLGKVSSASNLAAVDLTKNLSQIVAPGLYYDGIEPYTQKPCTLMFVASTPKIGDLLSANVVSIFTGEGHMGTWTHFDYNYKNSGNPLTDGSDEVSFKKNNPGFNATVQHLVNRGRRVKGLYSLNVEIDSVSSIATFSISPGMEGDTKGNSCSISL